MSPRRSILRRSAAGVDGQDALEGVAKFDDLGDLSLVQEPLGHSFGSDNSQSD